MAWHGVKLLATTLLSVMQAASGLIVFIDNSIHQIYKTLDALQLKFKNIKVFNDEKEGIDFVLENPVDLLFLNLDLIPNDAVSVTKEIRQKKTEGCPFIVIYSDKQDDFVQEIALNCGADSFINFHNKPAILQLFIRNLLARRKSRIRKNTTSAIFIDREQYLVFKKDEPIQFPKKEFKVFDLLFSMPDKFFTKLEIAIQIWGNEKIAEKRIIDVHIYNIRQQLGKRVIQSQKGKGYRINSKYI